MEAELKSVPSAAARTMTVTDDMMVRPSTVKYFILFVLGWYIARLVSSRSDRGRAHMDWFNYPHDCGVLIGHLS